MGTFSPPGTFKISYYEISKTLKKWRFSMEEKKDKDYIKIVFIALGGILLGLTILLFVVNIG
jgi:uncharacterized membrane protein